MTFAELFSILLGNALSSRECDLALVISFRHKASATRIMQLISLSLYLLVLMHKNLIAHDAPGLMIVLPLTQL